MTTGCRNGPISAPGSDEWRVAVHATRRPRTLFPTSDAGIRMMTRTSAGQKPRTLNWALPGLTLPKGWGLALLPTAFLIFFFILPVILLFGISFFQGRSFQIVPEFTLDNYIRSLSAAGFWKVTAVGLQNGFFTAAISVVMCFPVAWYMVYRTRSSLLLYLVLLSWFSSYLVRVYAWRTILGTNGVINSFLISVGVVDAPVSWLIFSPFATVITLIHIMAPFALLILVSALRDVKKDYLDAAHDLGSSQWALMTRVVLPMSYKGIVGAFMFTFILAAGDFITPQLLGGRNGVTTGLLISNQFRSAGNWPLGSAMAFILMVCFALVYLTLILSLRACRLSPGRRYHR